MAETAVIFDVDGVLLELTKPEEDAFFHPFEALHGLTGLSRDWDNYRIRNDENIIAEILERHFSRPPQQVEHEAIVDAYLRHLGDGVAKGFLKPKTIPGAQDLLGALTHDGIAMGLATANPLDAARIRLEAMELWQFVATHAVGADGGGRKWEVLTRAIASTGLAPDRIVYLGDNLTDVEAGLRTGVHFIGFSTEADQRCRLATAGVAVVAADHAESLLHIRRLLRRLP